MKTSLFTVLLSLNILCVAHAEDFLVVDASGKIIPAAAHEAPKDTKATVAADFYVEPSTLHSLGFEWNILGDDNRNGRVKVEYRRTGDPAWKEGHDLLRIHGEKVSTGLAKAAYTCGNLYAGSILFLEPGTSYDVKLTLHDDDGGNAEKLLQVATKTLPQMFEGGRKLHVYPQGYAGAKSEPSFADFMKAYADCQSGDQILLHAGNYSGNFKLEKAGTREKPIVIRDAGDGPVVIAGGGNFMDVTKSQYHWFHGLTFRGGAGAIYNEQGDAGTRGLTVTHCRFEDNYAGVFTRSTACRDLYVADNEFVGTKGTWHRAEEKHEPWKGVWVAGQGIDVCYNRATNLYDGVSTLQCPPNEDFARKLSAQDYYNNDVGQVGDDNEADFGQHNIRFFHNRLVDSHCGLSAQPFYGGPCYFVRNLQYNITRGVVFKLELQPAGVLIYNNTSVSKGGIGDSNVAGLAREWSNVQIYNNLFLGVAGPTLYAGPLDPGISRLDYNGYTFVAPIRWLTYDGQGKLKDMKDYKSLAEFTQATGFETHSVAISFKDLVNVKPPQGEAFDTDGSTIDARLASGSAAIDAGKVIPNITDGFAGKAPDLGAFELGQAPPHYGPRP